MEAISGNGLAPHGRVTYARAASRSGGGRPAGIPRRPALVSLRCLEVRELPEGEGLRTFVLVMDKGGDAAAQLLDFACDYRVGAAGLTAVGACRGATRKTQDSGP